MKKTYLAVALAIAGFAASTCAFAEKPSIGVAEFKNESSAGWWRGGVGWELSGMLSNELSSSGHFRVVERNKLEKVLEDSSLFPWLEATGEAAFDYEIDFIADPIHFSGLKSSSIRLPPARFHGRHPERTRDRVRPDA